MEAGGELSELAEEVLQMMKSRAERNIQEEIEDLCSESEHIWTLREEPSFQKLSTFLAGSDDQYDDLMLNLLEMTSAKFPSTFEEDTDNSTDPPEIVRQEVDKFTTKHQSRSQEFDLDFEGFWLICLLESERERVSAELQSFQIPFLGSSWVGKFGQSTAWSDLASHVERQGQPLARMCVDHAMAECLGEAKNLVKLQQLCQEWKMDHICLTFEEADQEFWSGLTEQLLRFPITNLDTNRGALIGCKKEDLRAIWESGVKQRWEANGEECFDRILSDDVDKEEQWKRLVAAQAMEEKCLINQSENKKDFLERLETQGATCPSGHRLIRIYECFSWTCFVCGEFHTVDRPWRCVEDRRLSGDCRTILGFPPEEKPECDTPFDVNHACMVKFAGAERDTPQSSEDEEEEVS